MKKSKAAGGKWLYRHVSYEVEASPEQVADTLRGQFQRKGRLVDVSHVTGYIQRMADAEGYRFSLHILITDDNGPSKELQLNGEIRRDGGRSVTRVTGRIPLYRQGLLWFTAFVVGFMFLLGFLLAPAPTLLQRAFVGLLFSGISLILPGFIRFIYIPLTLSAANQLENQLYECMKKVPRRTTDDTHEAQTTTQHLRNNPVESNALSSDDELSTQKNAQS